MIRIQDVKEITSYLKVPQDALKFVLGMTIDTPDGRYEFGTDCFVNVMHCDTKTEIAPMEAHEKFIDVQMVIAGEEKILYTAKSPLTVTEPYNAEHDIAFYAWESAEAVIYRGGEAVVLFPEEAHLPGRAVGEPMTIKKAVLKLRSKSAT